MRYEQAKKAGADGVKACVRRFWSLVLVHLAVCTVASIAGGTGTLPPDTRVVAPSFPGVFSIAGEILVRNLRVLVLIVICSAATAGIFGLFVHAVNGYFIGFLIQSAARTADVPLWLWAFVPLEMFAFAAAASAVYIASWAGIAWLRTERSLSADISAAAKVIGTSAAVLSAAALLESVLIRDAWDL